MACGGCRKKRQKTRYTFTCLNCGEAFNIDTSGRIIETAGKYSIKGVNTVTIKHDKCGSTRCKKN